MIGVNDKELGSKMGNGVKLGTRHVFDDSYLAAPVHWGTVFQIDALDNICLIIHICSYLICHMNLAEPCWLDKHWFVIFKKPTA
jgi:hypothetical protein